MDEKKLTGEEIDVGIIEQSVEREKHLTVWLWHNKNWSAYNLSKILDLIHRLQEENGNQVRMRCDMQRKFDDLQKLCIEQKAEIERLKNFIDFKTANVMCDKCKQQGVKGTAKDLLIEFNEWINEHYDAKYDTYCVCIPVDKVSEFFNAKVKEYGVEVN
jgi:hypothetical protein